MTSFPPAVRSDCRLCAQVQQLDLTAQTVLQRQADSSAIFDISFAVDLPVILASARLFPDGMDPTVGAQIEDVNHSELWTAS